MWTPKRVLLLMAGFGLFFTTYAVYAHFLGGIDGLPPLPKEYWPTNEPPEKLELRIRANEAERKLTQASAHASPEVAGLARLNHWWALRSARHSRGRIRA